MTQSHRDRPRMAVAGPSRELAGTGAALSRLVRLWSRRWTARAAAARPADSWQEQDLLVLDAVDAAARHTTEVYIADVAAQLGVDHSQASRSVAAAASRGYLQRGRTATDARRRAVSMTPTGRALLTGAHAWQDHAFTTLTAHWPSPEAAQLAHYLRRLADELDQPQQENTVRDPGGRGRGREGGEGF